jgi:hypothetical protein
MLCNIPIERLQMINEQVKACGIEKTAEMFNLRKETIQRYKLELERRNTEKTAVQMQSRKEESDKIETVFVANKQYMDAVEMAADCHIDLDVWFASSIVTNQWGNTDNPNWQFKVMWKRKQVPSIGDMEKMFLAHMEGKTPEHIEYTYRQGCKMLEISIPDLHLGRLAWDKESGADYDSKIAYAEWMKAHRYFITEACGTDIEQVLIIIGNDFFNVDNNLSTTTRGTQQTEDTRWQKSFAVGCEACVDAVDLWVEAGFKVEVKIVPGNHDTQRVFYLGMYLSAWYNKCKAVSIDNTPNTRKYYVWGRNLIGFSHGDKDYKRLKSVYQTEMREMLSECDNVEWHIAHTHQEKLIEDFGAVIIRTIPSLAQKSAWEYEMGFSGNRRAQAFVWDSDGGLMNIIYYTPDFERG